MDHLSAFALKSAAKAIKLSASLNLINTLFHKGIFLQALEQAVISPVHRAKSNKNLSNNSLVSVLLLIPKISEKNFITEYISN